jgi:uncharacterized membrane protein YccC
MTFLSLRAKRAIKIGLAMTIVYGLAMRMDWANPKWAAMSVGMISLAGVGQSLNKATLRLVGTLVSAIMAFIYLSFFVQDRWALLAVLTVHIAICSYMITGKRGSYAWFVGGYVCLIISAGGHSSADQIFHTAVARSGETILGIVVYTLISVFIWPQKNQGAMEEAANKLFSTQVTLYDNCRNLLTGANKTTDPCPSMVQEAQLLSQFEQFLELGKTFMDITMLLIVYFLSYLMVSSHSYNSFKHISKAKTFQVLVGMVLLLMVVATEPQITLFVLAGTYVLSGPLLGLYKLLFKHDHVEKDKKMVKKV